MVAQGGALIELPPLAGVRVVDLSRVLAGPYCTMLLADLGADVVKVERPGEGDDTRSWGPPYVRDQATYFLAVNRNKRSVALDLATPAGRAAARRLCERADVVIENFRVGSAEKLELGYDSLRERNARLVYCSITGFGSSRTPPARPGYDLIAQAECGLMSITGEPEGPPLKVGVALVDVLCGVHAATGILAALNGRDRSGSGAQIEVSLLDAGLASLINVAQAALCTGIEQRRYGNAHPSIVPYQPFAAADGWVAVAAPNNDLWRRLCAAIAREDLLADERFATNDGRVRHRDELVPSLSKTFITRPVAEWLDLLAGSGVPAGKVRGVAEAFEHAAASGDPAAVRIEHPSAGTLDLVRSPIRFVGTEQRLPTAPPQLGEHTADVLAEIGFDAGQLDGRGEGAD